MLVDGKLLRLEPLTEAHIASIIALEKSINSAPWSERAFRNELGHPHGVFLVATIEGRTIGYGGVWIVIDEAHITTVAVSSTMRRQGIGREIIRNLLKQAQERGAICATLEVRASNEAAISLYESMGFVSEARRKAYYPDNKEDAVVMWMRNLVV